MCQRIVFYSVQDISVLLFQQGLESTFNYLQYSGLVAEEFTCTVVTLFHLCTGPLTGGTTADDATAQTNATFSLLLPGSILDLTALNQQRKFRDKGNKYGAKLGWQLLQQCGLGELEETKARRGTDMVIIYYQSVQAFYVKLPCLMCFHPPCTFVHTLQQWGIP